MTVLAQESTAQLKRDGSRHPSEEPKSAFLCTERMSHSVDLVLQTRNCSLVSWNAQYVTTHNAIPSSLESLSGGGRKENYREWTALPRRRAGKTREKQKQR